ncbi:UNVERIFIED_CONTAM: hypothetical protein FKN15_038431 [Acipenser sinensis]
MLGYCYGNHCGPLFLFCFVFVLGVVNTISKLTKTCTLRLTTDKLYFILSDKVANGGVSMWCELSQGTFFDEFQLEGVSTEHNEIYMDLAAENLSRALKTAHNAKSLKIKLTNKHCPCITLAVELPSLSRVSRVVTHDIPVGVIPKKLWNDFKEPSVPDFDVSIYLPPLKTMKNVVERMKNLSNFLVLEANLNGEMNLKIETDLVSVTTHFKDLGNPSWAIVAKVKEVAQPDWAPPPEVTMVLTNDNFDEVVNEADIILVEFYAPWCGHCKQLAPEYEKAAKELSRRTPPIPLAKVDATAESEVATRFEVSGYPTLKIFRKGKAFEYNGPREKHGIVDYMIEQAGPPTKHIQAVKQIQEFVKDGDDVIIVGVFADDQDAALELYRNTCIVDYMIEQAGPPTKHIQAVKQIQEFVKDGDDVIIVGVFADDQDAALELYRNTCNNLREDYKFHHTFSNEIAKYLKASPGQVVMMQPEKFHSKFESKSYILTIKESTTEAEVKEFIDKHTLPLVGHRKQSNDGKRYTKRPMVVIYYGVDFSYDYRVATQFWRNKVLEVAHDFPEYTFVIADEEDYAEELKALGLSDSGEEVNVGILGDGGKKYSMEPEEFDSDVLREFVMAFKKGFLFSYVTLPKN